MPHHLTVALQPYSAVMSSLRHWAIHPLLPRVSVAPGIGVDLKVDGCEASRASCVFAHKHASHAAVRTTHRLGDSKVATLS